MLPTAIFLNIRPLHGEWSPPKLISGERALELLRAGVIEGKPHDIAVLDLMMPDMDGFQLAEAIKSDPGIGPVSLVLMPSFGKRGHGEQARQAGIAAYLQKPVRQSQLYDCLMAVMARRHTGDEMHGATCHPAFDARHRREAK